MATKTALKNYYRTFVPSMGLYLITLFGFTALNKAGYLTGIWPYVLSVIPGLCVLWFMFGHWRFIKECDELHRKVQTETILLATFIVLSLTTVIGLVQILTKTEFVGLFWVFPAFYAAYGICSFVISRRYGVTCVL